MGFKIDKNGRSFYEPNTFYIKYNPRYLDSDGIPIKSAVPVFFHEYAHLIQDTTTIYGVVDFLHFHDLIQDVCKITNSRQTIKIPISTYKEYSELWISSLISYKRLLYHLDEWSSKALWAFDEFVKFDLETIKYQNNTFETPLIRGKFIDHTLKEEDILHSIGVREIKEAYSMAIENIHSGQDYDYIDYKEFQYTAIERILSKMFGKIDNFEIITICHWCLNSLHPAFELVEIIEDVKRELFNLPSWKELYEFLRKRYLKNNQHQIKDIKNKYLDMLLNQEKSGKNDMLYQAYLWYTNNILINLDMINNHNSYFPLDTALCETSFEIKDFLQRFPIFLYENNGKTSYTLAANEKNPEFIYFFRSLASIITKLNDKQELWQCLLYDSCDFKKDICLKEPWKRWGDTPRCSYCSACFYLNLKDQSKLTSVLTMDAVTARDS